MSMTPDRFETGKVNVDRFLCAGDIDTHRLARDQKKKAVCYEEDETAMPCRCCVFVLTRTTNRCCADAVNH